MFLSVIEVSFYCITYTVHVALVCGLYMYVNWKYLDVLIVSWIVSGFKL